MGIAIIAFVFCAGITYIGSRIEKHTKQIGELKDELNSLKEGYVSPFPDFLDA